MRGRAAELNAAFEAAQRTDDRTGMARALLDLGVLAIDGGDVEAGTTSVGRGLELLGEVGTGDDRRRGLVAAARVAIAEDDPWTAARLLGAAAVDAGGADEAARLATSTRDALGVAAYEEERAVGAGLAPVAALALALARCGAA